jgi:hypothetical protein
MERVSPTPQYGPLSRGKAFVPSVGHGKLLVEGAINGTDNPRSHLSPSSSNNQSPPVSTEDTEIYSPHGSNKGQWTVKGQHADKGEERASFLYGRGHVPGATGSLSLGDQGFHGTPALFPGLYCYFVNNNNNIVTC